MKCGQVKLFDRRSRPAGDAETRDSTANPLKSLGRRVGLGLASSGRVASTVEGEGPAASGRGEVGGSSDASSEAETAFGSTVTPEKRLGLRAPPAGRGDDGRNWRGIFAAARAASSSAVFAAATLAVAAAATSSAAALGCPLCRSRVRPPDRSSESDTP